MVIALRQTALGGEADDRLGGLGATRKRSLGGDRAFVDGRGDDCAGS
jgi:hypothetical protein